MSRHQLGELHARCIRFRVAPGPVVRLRLSLKAATRLAHGSLGKPVRIFPAIMSSASFNRAQPAGSSPESVASTVWPRTRSNPDIGCTKPPNRRTHRPCLKSYRATRQQRRPKLLPMGQGNRRKAACLGSARGAHEPSATSRLCHRAAQFPATANPDAKGTAILEKPAAIRFGYLCHFGLKKRQTVCWQRPRRRRDLESLGSIGHHRPRRKHLTQGAFGKRRRDKPGRTLPVRDTGNFRPDGHP